jgi:gamma-glutamylcyclotransferase (GGCT)/AIG2-like uncharacterized protein YtfP
MASMPLLFSYGTLRETSVQLATFGRELSGREDALPGFTCGFVRSGDAEYLNAIPTADADHAVAGVAFEVTEEELKAADSYEEDADYKRVLVTLRSGRAAWVYMRA